MISAFFPIRAFAKELIYAQHAHFCCFFPLHTFFLSRVVGPRATPSTTNFQAPIRSQNAGCDLAVFMLFATCATEHEDAARHIPTFRRSVRAVFPLTCNAVPPRVKLRGAVGIRETPSTETSIHRERRPLFYALPYTRNIQTEAGVGTFGHYTGHHFVRTPPFPPRCIFGHESTEPFP
jgi:hypothetical protein